MNNSLLINNESEMQEMKIKFDGESHLIDANTLINSLIHFTNVVHEVNNELSHDSKKLDIKIKALPEGSFIVDFVLVTQNTIVNLLSPESIAYVAGLIDCVAGVYSIAKWLRGSKPEAKTEGNSTTLIKDNGESNVYDFRYANIYITNTTVQEAISKSFETLDEDAGVTGFELLDKNDKPIFVAEKEVFSDISNLEREVTKKEKEINITATLNVIGLDLELKKKWDFYYNGNKISAKIKDPNYIDIINSGERFGKGDTLMVEMEIRQEFHDVANVFVNKSYTVTKILKHEARPKPLPPPTLNFEENNDKEEA